MAADSTPPQPDPSHRPGARHGAGTNGAPHSDAPGGPDAAASFDNGGPHDLSPSATLPARGLGRIAARGMLWTLFSTAVTKLGGFISQIVLGWLLLPQEFSVYALALACMAFTSILIDAGFNRILIQRGEEYGQLARPFLALSLGFNLLAALILAGAAPWLAALYGAPDLMYLLWVQSVAIVIGAWVMIYRAKLAIALAFGRIARVSAFGALIRNAGMIGFALLGFGPLSFVLPQVMLRSYELYAFRRSAGPLPERARSQRLTWPFFTGVLRDAKWLMLGALAIAMVTRGDYFVIGLIAEHELLGYYFFGYMLTGAVTLVFTSGMQNVLMPTFSRMKQQRQRQAEAYLKTLEATFALVTPLVLVAALMAPLVIEWIWAGRWNPAIVVMQVLLMAAPFRIASTVSRALLESRGQWALRTIVLVVYAAGTLAGAAAGAATGELVWLVTSVAGWQVLFGLFQLYLGGRVSAAGTLRIVRTVTPFLAAALAAATVAILLQRLFLVPASLTLQTSVGFTAFVALYLLLMVLSGKWHTYTALVRRILPGPKRTGRASIDD